MILSVGMLVFSQVQLNMGSASPSMPFYDDGTIQTPTVTSMSTQQLPVPVVSLPLLEDSYDPSRYPVFESLPVNQLPIKTGIVTVSPMIGEAMHFLYDGVLRSDALDLVGVVSLYGENTTNATTIFPQGKTLLLTPHDADLWIVDGARIAKLKRPFLDQLIQTTNPSWKVLFVDFTDRFQFQMRHYQKLKIWDQMHIRLAVRSIVQGRHFQPETNKIIPGRLARNIPTAGGPMLHSPYAARTDIIQAIQQVVGVSNTTITALATAIFDPRRQQRPIDVLHPWNISFKEGKSKLRNAVTKLVRSWNGTLQHSNRFTITSIEEQGERRHVGRNMVDPRYVRAMLAAKIVVVTQKDDWEDHYRLFESMSCGALVLHDSMIAPPNGLIDGENIVFFKSLEELEERVIYYLENDQQREMLAKRGWRMTFERHRSWHRMEELIFGRPLTTTNIPNPNNDDDNNNNP